MSTDKKDSLLLTRREVLVAGASAGALAFVGCGTRAPGTGHPDGIEVSAELWQTMGYARADGTNGTRVNLFNPASVPHRVVVQVFSEAGELVVKDYTWEDFAPLTSWHIELDELLAAHGVPLPFAGSWWIGAAPASGEVFMGLQGIGFDWHAPGYLASVHGMRDFGNSNQDTSWTDLVLPKVVVGSRYVTRLAILNASADGISEAFNARPEVILRYDDGSEAVRTTLDALPPYGARLVDVRDLVGSTPFELGTVQIREPQAGLVAFGLLMDTTNNAILSADHLFDRHFVVDGSPLG